jgi:proteasome component ECM29
MASSEVPDEQKELSLVNKLELRIALTKEDKKLEALLKTFLAPLHLKLKSPHFSVLRKTTEVSKHINYRIESLDIQLPVLPLLKQLKEHGESKVLRIVNVGYIRTGLSRIKSQEELNEVFLEILGGVSKFLDPPTPTGAILLHLLFELLPRVQFPKRGDPSNVVYRETLGLAKVDAQALVLWFGKLLLFPYETSSAAAQLPYLSKADAEFLAVPEINQAWNTESPLGLSVAKTKSAVIDFVDTGAFLEQERLLTYIFAGPESNPSSISEKAARYIKVVKLDEDDDDTIAALYRAYFQDKQLDPDAMTDEATPAEALVPITLKTRILNILLKSQKISKHPEETVRILQGHLQIKASSLVSQRYNAAFVEFIIHAFRLMNQDFRKDSAVSLISKLKDFITLSQGWPNADPGSDLQTRGQAYRLIGLAAQEGNVLDLDLLDFLAGSLNEDNSGRETMLYVEEAMSSITQALCKTPLDNDTTDALENWLDGAVESLKRVGQGRKVPHKSYPYIISRIANRCLPYNSVSARYANLLVLGSSPSFEAKEEATFGLNPHLFRMNNSHRPDLWYNASDTAALKIVDPDCCDFLWANFAALGRRVFPDIQIRDFEILDVNAAFDQLRHQWSSSPAAFVTSLRYIYRMFMMNAITSNPSNSGKMMVTESWETQMDLSLEQPIWQSKGLQVDLLQPTVLLFASSVAFAVQNGSQEAVNGQQIFTSLLQNSYEPQKLKFLPFALRTIIPAVQSKQHATRHLASQCFGILYADIVNGKLEAEYSELSESLKQLMSKSISVVLTDWTLDTTVESWGGLLALAHTLCRITGDVSQIKDELFPLTAFCSALLHRFANETNPEGLEAAVESFGLLGSWRVFGRVINFPVNEVKVDDKPFDVSTVVDKLQKLAKDGNESAILNLGKFSLWLDQEKDAETLGKISDILRECHELKQTATQFTVGKALSYLAFSSVGDPMLSDGRVQLPSRSKLFSETLSRTIKDCLQPKPALRRAATIWLLCLIERGDAEQLQQYLPDCQKAFTACLSNRDVLTREAAAKGLNLLFDKGNAEIQDKLIKDFTDTFTTTKTGVLSGAVSEQTELFDEGALKTDTGSVSTYKDILDLASEMGNPGLVYQFMSLAADSAIWTSRIALANGLSTDLSEKLEKQMLENKNFFPVLYRYRFDPNPTVRRSMQSLWKNFVRKPAEVFDMHFDAIMADLLKNILSKLWRWRETSCLALADLLQDQKFERYEKYLEEIWRSCAKVMDDIKSSVRAAALKLAKTLTNVLVRKLESKESSKEASKMVDLVVPFLSSPDMLEAPAEEVKVWAITTLLKIVTEARGSVIESQAPSLLKEFLQLFTALESGSMNWLHLNADKYNIDPADIDKARVTGTIRDNPVMRAVEKLVDNSYARTSTADKIVQVLEESCKTSIGLPSLAATSHVIVTMMLRYHARYKDYSDRLLLAARKPLLDRNPTVQAYFATSIGYIARWASDAQVIKTADYCWELWRDSGNTTRRITAGEVFHSIAKHAPETFSRLSSKFLPFVFIGKHDDEEDVKDAFKKAWEESAGGQRAILLHLEETVKIASSLLENNQWTIKHAGARSIAEATDAVASLDPMSSPVQAPKVWPSLEKALGGRSWEGKEVILKAFVDFVSKVKGFWEKDEKIAQLMNKIMIREAKRDNRAYQTHAYALLGEYAAAREDLDLSEAVMEIVKPTVETLTKDDDENKMDVDGDDDTTKVKEGDKDAILLGAIKAVRSALYSPLARQSSEHSTQLVPHLTLLSKANSTHSRPVSLEVLTTLKDTVFPELNKSPSSKVSASQNKKLIVLLGQLLFQPRYNAFPEDGRLQRAKTLAALADVGSSGSSDWLVIAKEVILGEGRLDEVLQSERVPRVKEALIAAGKTLE